MRYLILFSILAACLAGLGYSAWRLGKDRLTPETRDWLTAPLRRIASGLRRRRN